MGNSHPGRTPNSTYYTHKSYVDGSFGEIGDTYIVTNNCARFSSLGFEHEFIIMDNEEWHEYKVYEWTIKNFLAYACSDVKFKEKEYLGKFKVSFVYKAALEASRGKEFNTLKYNCKDWVKAVKSILISQ